MIKFCTECGSPTQRLQPPFDDRLRAICSQCGFVHYENPRIVTCVLPLWQGKIMLCRRGIDPRLGYWTLPGGFMENGESTEASAIRETKEETGASIHGLRLQSMISLPEYDQVHLFYRAQLTRPEWHLTHESTAIELLSLTQIPWAELAFSTVKLALEHHVRLERGEAEPFLDSVIAVPAPK